MTVNFQPTFNRVLVEKEEVDDKLGSFFIPELSKVEGLMARVIAVGPGYYTEDGVFFPTTVKPGDRVLVSRWAGYQVKINGKEYMWMYEFRDKRNDIWGLVPEGVSVQPVYPKQSKVDRVGQQAI